jgi:hypothetical protein
VALVLSSLGVRAAEDIPLRREESARFAVDEGLQAGGGVQYWYALEHAVDLDFLDFDPLQPTRTAGHVLHSRLVHTLDKDSSFFTPARVLDVKYMNSVAPGYDISQQTTGRFHCARTPANTFTLRFISLEATPPPREPGVTRLLELCALGTPESVVVQNNTGFSRVLGMRTAEASSTWTGHYRLGPDRTRLCVVSMSYIFTVPPFFLGGDDRLLSESVRETLELIRHLRAYAP